ncbi:MAG: DUF5674 family protein [Candidatus Omnitrophica bacterium]|nr:DUF5674 family protein [Candidatus Omnitrophota bacterium]MCM8810923.1 DUF5674 family protein [Candidatus Omnitrophota bacterium]
MIKIVSSDNKIKMSELKKIAEEMFDILVKGVVDIEKEILVIGGELHSDEEALLLENGSKHENLWGINLYPDEKENFIEFGSVINIKPSLGNKSRDIEDPEIKEKIKKIVEKLVINDLL